MCKWYLRGDGACGRMDWKGTREQINNAVMVVLGGHMTVTHRPSASDTSLDYDIGLYGGSFLLSVSVDKYRYKIEMLKSGGQVVGKWQAFFDSFQVSTLLEPVREAAKRNSHWERWQIVLIDAFYEVGFGLNSTFQTVEKGLFKVLLLYEGGCVHFEMHYGGTGSTFYQFLKYPTGAVIGGSRRDLTGGLPFDKALANSIVGAAITYLDSSETSDGGSVADTQRSPSANAVAQTSRPWKDWYMYELHKRMCAIGGGDGGPNELRCVIDMFEVEFKFEMTDPGKEDFQIKCIWGIGDEISDTVHGQGGSASDLVGTIVTKIRERVSKKSTWLYWQRWLVNELCDKGVVPGRTRQASDKQRLTFMLSKGDSNYNVEIRDRGSSSLSCEFVSCANNSVLIRRTWDADSHPPSMDRLAKIILDDLEKAPDIENCVMSPILTGPESKIVSGAGGGAAVSSRESEAVTKLRFYEAFLDFLIQYRKGDISEESVKAISEFLHPSK
jgi:hypothetical protein